MSDPQTPEEEYERLLAAAWALFVRGDQERLSGIERLLTQANAEIGAVIFEAAGADGQVSLESMGRIRARLDAALGAFRAGYQAALDRLLEASAREAYVARMTALDAYVGPAAARFQMRLNETTREVVEAMRTRSQGGLRFSERIWRLDRGTRLLLEQEIMGSITAGRSAADMARRVSQYLLPGQELPRGDVPSAVYSGQPRDVSYNAYRLARTEINQTYHAASGAHDQEMARGGLALGTRWKLSSEHARRMLAATQGRTSRDICDEWAARMPGSAVLKGQPSVSAAEEQRLLAQLTKYGINAAGVYVAGKAPVDHPNGLCTQQTVLKPHEALVAEGII